MADGPQKVIEFWTQAGPGRWFKKNKAFDDRFREAFFELHFQAARRELDAWQATTEGALALLLLLDQYPRNAFRGTGHMYATDSLARLYACNMVNAGQDLKVALPLRRFCYLPFEHSEAWADQEVSLRLNQALDPGDFKWAKTHAQIIQRFGRFPHRNLVLGRASTAEERAYLDSGGFAG